MDSSIFQRLANSLFDFESNLCRKYNEKHRLRFSSSPYVSGDSFRTLADHVFDETGMANPLAVRRGDRVFVKTDMLERFEQDVLPRISEPFILISHNSDHHIDHRFDQLLSDNRVHRWFAQNVLITHPKLVQIPIGLENRWWHKNGIVRDFRRLSRSLPLKTYRILYAFTLNTNEIERRPALLALKRSHIADTVDGLNSRAYRKVLARYAFVASPPGNGIDCHRTWEALYLDTVPVIKRSAFYEGFPGLPVLAVDNWDAVENMDDDFLITTYRSLRVDPHAIKYLWMDYWRQLIESAQKECITESNS